MFHTSLWRRLTILAPCLLLGGSMMAGTAITQSTAPVAMAAKRAEAQCSLSTLNGRYVFSYYGFQIVDHNRIPSAYAGIGVYDGHGHVQGVTSQSTDGKATSNIHYTGTYTVTPNCIVAETDTDATGSVSHYDEFTTSDGSTLTFVETDTGFVATGVETRGTGQ